MYKISKLIVRDILSVFLDKSFVKLISFSRDLDNQKYMLEHYIYL